jgi:aminoglycoside phosphotransferase (APT) family kinase protein
MIVRRTPNDYESTFASEVVTCRLPDDSRRQLFCKYGPHRGRDRDRHRGGVTHEAEAYRCLLQPIAASAPRYYGTYTGAAGQVWLILEYVARSVPLTLHPRGMRPAARWIGHFHALQACRARSWPASLRHYDRAYYTGWARRLFRLAGHWHHRFPWLAPLYDRAQEWAAVLLTAPPTVIHGEFYPGNILCRGRAVYPIDWESAAVAAGEIDLASLLEGWPARYARRYARVYREARWPGGAPGEFERRLAAAQIYLAFRWLADEPDRPPGKNVPGYFHQLRSAGRRLGLIEGGRGPRGRVPSR